MKIILGLALMLLGVSSLPVGDTENGIIEAVEPEHLDMLLETKQYDQFNRLMGIDIPCLSHPREENCTHSNTPSEELRFGDILLTPEQTEQARQGLRFDRRSSAKWSTKVVPYTISNQYTNDNKNKIEKAVRTWNSQVQCIKWRPRGNEQAYVQFHNGNKCYSNFGRTGRQQSIILSQNFCMDEGTILHEMTHAIGFAHEHNRSDRDKYVRILWNNIPEGWKPEYKKTDPNEFGLQDRYDYYSIMHYPLNAPTTSRPAFDIFDKSINTGRMGRAQSFTDIDKKKISILYC